jgi:beta-lactamase regulating signal transducer with metallopeptidase domain
MNTEMITRAAMAISGNVLATTILKATLAMIVATLLLRALRRAPASLRHSVVAATFGVILFLPLASMFIPERPVTFNASRAKRAPVQKPTSATVVHVAQTTRSNISFAAMAERVYLAGAAFFVLSLLGGIVRLHRIAGRAKLSVPATKLAGIQVAISSEIGVPVTFQSPRPIILLPASSAAWSEEELSRVLRHELEHISRGDWVTQIVCRLACAIYWPHPFAWALWRRLRLEAERACDDAVVLTRGEAEPYAEQLVSLARSLGSVPALAMATPSSLGVRIEAILDGSLRRSPLTRAGSLAVVIAAVTCMVFVAPVKLMSAGAADEQRYKTEEDAGDLEVALMHAADIGDVQIIRRYLDLGAKANAAISGDGSPLIAASRKGHVEAMQALIAAGADVNLGVPGDGNALTEAARRGQLEAVRLLLDRGADIDRGIPGDGNALIMAAGAGQVDVVRYLLDRGASIEKVVPGDENALIHASETGAAEVVRLLIDRHANPNARVWSESGDGDRVSGEWRTPLSMARRNQHADVVSLLLAAGAKE